MVVAIRDNPQNNLKIPVRSDFVSMTGSYESAIILNQILFSSKDALTLKDIRYLTLSDRTKQTLRKSLNILKQKGLIECSRSNELYNCNLYSPAKDLYYSTDSPILALVEGVDLLTHPCYLTASILNKLRFFVLSGMEEISISAESFKKILATEKSSGLIRLILRRLAKEKYITENLNGRTYTYKLNRAKLISSDFNEEEADAQANSLLSIFLSRITYEGGTFTKQQKSSWKMTFKRMMSEGYNYQSVKHILAFIGLNRESYSHITTPVKLRQSYTELSNKSSELSKRKGLRFIFKLLNDLLPKVSDDDEKTATNEIKEEVKQEEIAFDSHLAWEKAYQFVNKKKNTFRNWFFKQAAGVSDVDYDDYISQALLIAYGHFMATEGEEDSLSVSTIKYRLQDYMYRHRASDKDRKSKDSNTIIQFHHDDISDLDIGSWREEEYTNNDESELSIMCENLLEKLEPRLANIIYDYHGLSGKTFTFKEIAEKYGLSSDGYACRLYHKGMTILRSLAPPEFKNSFNIM